MENLYLAFSDTSGNVWLIRVDPDTGLAVGTLYEILVPPTNYAYSVAGMAYDKDTDAMYLSIIIGRTDISVPPTWSLYVINKFTYNLHHSVSLTPQQVLNSSTLIRGIAYKDGIVYGIGNGIDVYLISVSSPDLNTSITLYSTSLNFGDSVNLAIFDNTLYLFDTPSGITALFTFALDGTNGSNNQIIAYPNNYNYFYSPPGIYSITANKHGTLYQIYVNATEPSPGNMFLSKYDKSKPFTITQVSSAPILNGIELESTAGALAFIPEHVHTNDSSSSFGWRNKYVGTKCNGCGKR
jgi:hypothetical protein